MTLSKYRRIELFSRYAAYNKSNVIIVHYSNVLEMDPMIKLKLLMQIVFSS